MLIISRTPVRISFFGGGTDYPQYYARHAGAVLGTTIDKYTHVSVHTSGKYFDHKIRVGYSQTELVKKVDEIAHPSVRECLKFKQLDEHLEIHIFSDLPAKSGLGSSSSFTVSLLNALYALKGQRISRQQLAEEACFVEQELIRENVGSQDQFHTAFGGLNLIEFGAQGTHVRPVVAASEKIRTIESHLLLLYTGLTRHASEILTEQMERTRDLSNDQYLQQMYEMVFEAEEILSREPKEQAVKMWGHLLDKGWSLKKRLSTKISNPLIDQAYETAKRAGAYGGKLCGAGSGGFLALLAPPETHQHIQSALPHLMHVPVSFENSGSSIIYMKE